MRLKGWGAHSQALNDRHMVILENGAVREQASYFKREAKRVYLSIKEQ